MTERDQTVEDLLRAHFRRIDEGFDYSEAECVGFYGYAAGRTYEAIRELMRSGGSNETPCQVCRKRAECWEAHKEIAKQIMPVSVFVFEELVSKTSCVAEALSVWSSIAPGRPDPYMDMMFRNVSRASGKPETMFRVRGTED